MAAVAAVVLAGLLLACGREPDPTQVPPTATAVPTSTPAPTATPVPTSTPVPPTATPVPVPTPAAAPAPAATPSPGASVDALDVAEILAANGLAMAQLETFRVDMETIIKVDQGGMAMEIPVTMRADFRLPGDSSGSTVIDLGFFSMETKFVVVGGESYATDPETGEWVRGLSAEDTMFIAPDDLIGLPSDSIWDVESLEVQGVDEIDGVPSYRIALLADEIPLDLFGDGPSDGFAMSFWIGVEDKLLRGMEISGLIEAGDDPSAQPDDLFGGLGGGDLGFEVRIRLSDFNEPVEIEAPEEFIDLGSAMPGPEGFEEIPVVRTALDSGWVRSDLPTEGMSVDFPASWETFSLDSDSIELALSDLASEDYRFQVVAEQALALQEAGGFKLFGFDSEGGGGAVPSTMNILTEEGASALDVDAYADLNIQLLREFFGIEDVERRNLTLPAGEAVEITYSMTLPSPDGGEMDISQTQYLIFHDMGAVVVTFAVSDGGAVGPFEEIVSTLRLYGA